MEIADLFPFPSIDYTNEAGREREGCAVRVASNSIIDLVPNSGGYIVSLN